MNKSCTLCFEDFTDYEKDNKAEVESDIRLSIDCKTKNCECLICYNCEMKMLNNNNKDVWKCPLCRQYKYGKYDDDIYFNIHLKIYWLKRQKEKIQLENEIVKFMLQ